MHERCGVGDLAACFDQYKASKTESFLAHFIKRTQPANDDDEAEGRGEVAEYDTPAKVGCR